MKTGQRIAITAMRSALQVAQFGLEVYADLTPGVRMRGLRRLPQNLGAGILGAEVATWWAISPSLLPRKWWVTAANVAICQGFGHAVGTGVRFLLRKIRRTTGRGPTLKNLQTFNAVGHVVLGVVTGVVALRAPTRHRTQVELVELPRYVNFNGPFVGAVVGTAGYGVILLLGEALQNWIDRTNHQLRRWLPPVISWPAALIAVGTAVYFTTDRMLIRRWLSNASKKAELLNQQVFPGARRPREPERSASRESLESWDNVGRQGRALLSAGPRKSDIHIVIGEESTEPIRIFAGRIEGRTTEDQVNLVLAEMERTGAFRRPAIAIMTSAGTGWLNDFSTSSFEFLTRGNCAIVGIQYSFMPSALSYVVDRTSPVAASKALIKAVRARIDELPEGDRPKLYVAGESLGAYGIADSFATYEELLDIVDGAVFTGAPGFTRMHARLTRRREAGSPERLPLIDGGRNVRFVATPAHLHYDYAGDSYRHQWNSPRVIFAQHASDPVVWWDWDLFLREPDWLREPGSRGVPAPEAQQLDVFQGLRWVPFITGWQVGLDQVNSLDFPGAHGHAYHDETIAYWAAVLDIELTPAHARRIARWIRRDIKRVRDQKLFRPRRYRQNSFSAPSVQGNPQPSHHPPAATSSGTART
ncbi:alpha/beta-hydrolase family protein [Corynebacterium breve]|uniref:Alpha/beta-hydrolase family protein n=1 Tax=Corynebacterium breve TaxID=3049799 RepID=A0ABY8VEL2_9CORY|nr:alpha/beta-hydrolase family protein [Corynebacterium breve]WIM67537.1 alpha/beta-hydrolase family protein [Corynebacterium breve]